MKKLLRVLHYFRQDILRIVLVTVLMVLAAVVSMLKPWPLAIIVDHLLGEKPLPAWMHRWIQDWPKVSQLTLLAVSIVAIHWVHAGISALYNYWLIKTGLRGLARVRMEVFQKLQQLSLRYFQGARQGDVIYRASWDTFAFHTLFQHGLFTFVSASLSLAFMVVVMAQLNWSLTVVALTTVPPLILVIRLFGGQMSQRGLKAQQADSAVTSAVQQSIVSLPLTQSYNHESVERQRFQLLVNESLLKRTAQHGWEVFYLAGVALIFGIGLAATAWLGGYEVWEGRLTLGELLVFLSYLGQFYEPLNQLSHVGATASSAAAGTQRVFEILDTPVEIQEKPNALPACDARKSMASVSKASSELTPVYIRGKITFDTVSFEYQPGHPVLNQIHLTVNPGETVALIGPSGAGKSTLIHLLPRFFDPLKGKVLLDDVDIRDLRLHELRQQIALVMQDSLLLPGTVAENIGFGKPGSSIKEIEAAAQAANAAVFIEKLPKGYDTLIGEGAARLSVGEKQRISLARAFLKDAPIVLLDEPTSSLDAENEELVMKGLQTLMQGRTSIIVAHRLSTIRHSHKIFVLENGSIVESGTPEDLLRASGYLARVVNVGQLKPVQLSM